MTDSIKQTCNPMFTMQSAHIALLMWGCVFCTLSAISVYKNKGMKRKKRLLLFYIQFFSALLLLADTLAWAFKGHAGTLGYYMVRLANFFVFFVSDVVTLFFHLYVCHALFANKTKKVPKRVQGGCAITLLGMVLVVVSQFTNLYYYFDTHNVYHRNPAHFLSMLIPLACVLIDVSLLLQYRKTLPKETFRTLLTYLILPTAGAMTLLFYYGISLVNIGIGISAIAMFFVAIREQDKDLTEMRIAVLLSQIKPHFIYNTITAIQELCREDAERAVQVIGDFADYLRGNLDALTLTHCIPFSKELEHTKKYLAIEKERFGDRIQVVYDIQVDAFFLPALTLQPIVENAVKHGITKKRNGGTISISTYQKWEGKKHFYCIRVADDGVGFTMLDTNVGIENVKNRLDTMCNGTLKISSTCGEGTVVEIKLP